MPVRFVGASALGGMAANPSDFSLTLPTVTQYDIILVSAMCKNIAGLNEVNVPTDFTEKGSRQTVDGSAAADDMRTSLFWKRATGSETTVAMTKGGASTVLFAAVAHVWRGCVMAGDPFDPAGLAYASSATPGDIIGFPAFDPVAPCSRVIYDGWYADDVISPALAGFTNGGTPFGLDNGQETPTGSDATHAIWSAIRNGDALGSINAVCAGQDGSYIGYAYALLPASERRRQAGFRAVRAPTFRLEGTA